MRISGFAFMLDPASTHMPAMTLSCAPNHRAWPRPRRGARRAPSPWTRRRCRAAQPPTLRSGSPRRCSAVYPEATRRAPTRPNLCAPFPSARPRILWTQQGTSRGQSGLRHPNDGIDPWQTGGGMPTSDGQDAPAVPLLGVTAILDSPLVDRAGERLGRVDDVIARFAEGGHPPVTGLVGRLAGRRLYIPGAGIREIRVGPVPLTGDTLNRARFQHL